MPMSLRLDSVNEIEGPADALEFEGSSKEYRIRVSSSSVKKALGKGNGWN
jgi:hypothetical protein